jgi:transposase
LVDRVFSCKPDAETALNEFLNDHDKHCFDIEAEVIETEQKKSRDQPGRPPKDWEPYETVYKIAASVHRDAAAITERKKKASCFVVVTTLTNAEEWSAERVLDEYKNQQAVERRFPVLKDPKHVGPVFLDRPDRVEALGYVLLMALLVYSLIERRARLALQDEDDPMELAGGPTSFRPTGRRVLERFENMLVMEVDGTREIPDNVTIPERVLDFLGLDITVYGVESEE